MELERLALGIGASFALSIVATLVLLWLPGSLTVGRVLLANDLLVIVAVAALALVRAPVEADDDPVGPLIVGALLAILLLGGALRTVNLGYSEFQDDEIDITQVSVQAILGDPNVVLEDTRGPARTMLVNAFFLYTGRVGEIDVRLPSALASTTTILALFWLGRRLFGPSVGLIAAAVAAVEGITLGYGRIVQQEDLINMWAVLAILCFVQGRRRADRPAGGVYQIIGALFFAVGLLAHYEVALLSPILLWLWFTSRRNMPSGRWRRSGLIGAVIVLLVAASFYLPFSLASRFGATVGYYSKDVLGSGLADNLGQFLNVSTFYNSAFLVVALVLLWIAAIALSVWRRSRGLAMLCGVGSLVLVVLSVALPGHLAGVGLLWWTSVLILALVIADSEPFKIVFVWLMMYFVPYVYVVAAPHMHFYVFTMPLALLAGYGLSRLWGLMSAIPRVAVATLLAGCYVLAIYHGAAMFVSHQPEWAMVQPEQPLALHPKLHSGRPGEFFGLPQKSGWRTIAALYRAGILRGPYVTNELYQKADWYLHRVIRQPGVNRYYFVAESPHRLQAGPAPEPFVQADYWPIGAVTVDGQVKLRLFERRQDGAAEPEFVTYSNETYETAPDGVRSLETYRLWRRYQADDQFFADLAAHLASAAAPGDGLILDAPAQAELLSAYYTGTLPYYGLPAPGSTAESAPGDVEAVAAKHPRLFACFWAADAVDPSRAVESWLDGRLFKADSRWFGNVRLAVYAAAGPSDQVWHPVDARFGDAITLESYGLPGGAFHGGDILPLTLRWQVGGPLPQRYTVFVHVTAQGQGRIAAQRDSEPAGGSRPTDGWRPGDVVVDNQGVPLPADIAAGRYEIAVGLYDPATGARLPAADRDGKRFLDDGVPLGTMEVVTP